MLTEGEQREGAMVLVDPEVRRQMKDDGLRDEAISAVVEECEARGEYLLDRDSGRRICHLKQGYITIWVEYAAGEGKSLTVHKVYSHRMTLKDGRIIP